MNVMVMRAQHAEKSRQGNICSPGWLHSLLLSSLVLLYECWSHSMTGNPIIIVIVVIIIITTQVGTQKLTSGKLRREDCFVLRGFFVAYFYDRSVFQQMLSRCLLYQKKANKAINHDLPYSAFWVCQIVLEGRWAGKEGASVPSLGSSSRDAASGACSFREVCKREEDSVPSLCLPWWAQAVLFVDSAMPLLSMTARVPAGLAGDGCLPEGHKDPR